MAGPEYDPVQPAKAETRALWRDRWVYVGLSTELAEAGQILPFTLPDVGVHIERMPDKTAEARLNRAQQGGCIVIPQQCDRGTKICCPQLACAFSRDRLPVITATTPNRERLLFQFKGNRPDRLPTIEMREKGGVIAVRLLALTDANIEDSTDLWPSLLGLPGAQTTFWQEIPENWKIVAHHLASGAAGFSESIKLPRLEKIEFHSPNAITLQADDWGGFVILQPLARRRTRCRVYVLTPPDSQLEARRSALASLIEQVCLAAVADGLRVQQVSFDKKAECLAKEPGRSLFAMNVELDAAASAKMRNGYRLNPRFGFVGG
jgi:hypothetical protein